MRHLPARARRSASCLRGGLLAVALATTLALPATAQTGCGGQLRLERIETRDFGSLGEPNAMRAYFAVFTNSGSAPLQVVMTRGPVPDLQGRPPTSPNSVNANSTRLLPVGSSSLGVVVPSQSIIAALSYSCTG